MVGMFLYPAQLVLSRGEDVGVPADTLSKIRVEYFDTQQRVADIEPRVKKGQLEIQKLIAAGDFDEGKITAQIDEVAKAEGETKKQQFVLMLHIRQMLTADQRKKLDELKHAPPPPPPPPAGNTGPGHK